MSRDFIPMILIIFMFILAIYLSIIPLWDARLSVYYVGQRYLYNINFILFSGEVIEAKLYSDSKHSITSLLKYVNRDSLWGRYIVGVGENGSLKYLFKEEISEVFLKEISEFETWYGRKGYFNKITLYLKHIFIGSFSGNY